MRRSNAGHRGTAGFTLLELMASMIILTISMLVAFEAFNGTIRGWRRGTEVVEGIKHGEFAMKQMAAALNSAIYFYDPRNIYGFVMEKNTFAGMPADTISFVTASSAFVPEWSPLRHSPHRIIFFIEDDGSGRPALFAFVSPAIADVEESIEEYNAEPFLVSRAVQGIDVQIYNQQLEEWLSEDWNRPHAIPERLLLTLFVGSDEEDEEPIAFSRVIEIPVAPSAKYKLRGPTQSPQQGGRK
jgi:prepilin-type N-terminal cleavage/methylation domain-containing protein